MIKAFHVTNHRGDTLDLELGSPEKSGLLVTSADGLGPPTATINTAEMATVDGARYNSAKAQTRNITVELKPLRTDTETVEDNRQKAYKFFPIKKRIKFEIETDNRLCYAYGYVESVEPDIFSEDERIDISILCPDSYLYATEGTSTAFYGADPMFEFEFSDDDSPSLNFGEIRVDNRAVLVYEGDMDTGAEITLHALGDVSGIKLFNVNSGESMTIDTDKIETIVGSAMASGDDIVISTYRGSKYAKFLRNGYYYNILPALNKDCDWFQLSQGDNLFGYSVDEGEKNLLITFKYHNAYGGI